MISLGAGLWTTPDGERVELDRDVIEALSLLQETFPGSRGLWWRRPGERWRQLRADRVPLWPARGAGWRR